MIWHNKALLILNDIWKFGILMTLTIIHYSIQH